MVTLNPTDLRYIRRLLYWGGLFFYVYRIVWRNRKDRVLLCEAIGVGVFVAALLMWHSLRLSDLFIELSAVLALFFGGLAAYFALLNWAERWVRKAKAK